MFRINVAGVEYDEAVDAAEAMCKEMCTEITDAQRKAVIAADCMVRSSTATGCGLRSRQAIAGILASVDAACQQALGYAREIRGG